MTPRGEIHPATTLKGIYPAGVYPIPRFQYPHYMQSGIQINVNKASNTEATNYLLITKASAIHQNENNKTKKREF